MKAYIFGFIIGVAVVFCVVKSFNESVIDSSYNINNHNNEVIYLMKNNMTDSDIICRKKWLDGEAISHRDFQLMAKLLYETESVEVKEPITADKVNDWCSFYHN